MQYIALLRTGPQQVVNLVKKVYRRLRHHRRQVQSLIPSVHCLAERLISGVELETPPMLELSLEVAEEIL